MLSPSVGPGPYFVLQGYLQGQKFSQRVPADQAAAVASGVANYKRFQELADEFVTVTEQLTLQTETAAKRTPGRGPPRAIARRGVDSHQRGGQDRQRSCDRAAEVEVLNMKRIICWFCVLSAVGIVAHAISRANW